MPCCPLPCALTYVTHAGARAPQSCPCSPQLLERIRQVLPLPHLANTGAPARTRHHAHNRASACAKSFPYPERGSDAGEIRGTGGPAFYVRFALSATDNSADNATIDDLESDVARLAALHLGVATGFVSCTCHGHQGLDEMLVGAADLQCAIRIDRAGLVAVPNAHPSTHPAPKMMALDEPELNSVLAPAIRMFGVTIVPGSFANRNSPPQIKFSQRFLAALDRSAAHDGFAPEPASLPTGRIRPSTPAADGSEGQRSNSDSSLPAPLADAHAADDFVSYDGSSGLPGLACKP